MIVIIIKIYSVKNTLGKSIKITNGLNVTFKQIWDSSAANLRKSQPELNPEPSRWKASTQPPDRPDLCHGNTPSPK
jgi:hypothetical protein